MPAALNRLLAYEPHEAPAIAWSFAYFFLLLCSYYLLRPVRDALAVESGTQSLQWLFTATFVAPWNASWVCPPRSWRKLIGCCWPSSCWRIHRSR